MAVVDANEASCDGPEPGLVATLAPSTADYLRITPVGDRLYINIYDMLEPDYKRPGTGGYVGGQTWVTGRCGEDAVLVGEGTIFSGNDELATLTPALYGEGADPTFACAGGDRVYRVDLTGVAPPELLLAGWACGISTETMVTSYRDEDVSELWRVPSFPDLDGAVRLADDVKEEVGGDATHKFYLDNAQALHAVDFMTGVDEVVLTGVSAARGGATSGGGFAGWAGPTRLLMFAEVSGEAEGVYLYRGETGEVVRLADVQPADLPESPQSWLAWDFNITREFIYHRPYGGDDAFVRLFDLDGAPLVFPEGVRAEWVNGTGVIGMQGPQWVFARPGQAEATVLDMPWDPDVQISGIGSEYIYWYEDSESEQMYHTPLDGGPTVPVDDFGYQYAEHDALMQQGDQLLHVDRDTKETTVLVDAVGVYGAIGDLYDGEWKNYGVFYTDVSDPEAPGLWFMPMAALPGGA